MPTANNVLHQGSSGRLVLAADYSAPGRLTATFTDLVSRLGSAHTVWETAPPPFGTESSMSGEDHVRRWLEDVRDAAMPVHAILGFCAGAVFAAALAERVEQWQGTRPTLVLFDPESPSRDVLHLQYHKMVNGSLASVLSPTELAEAQRAGWEAKAQDSGLLEMAVALGKHFTEYGGPALERTRLEHGRSEQFLDIFSSSMCYLAASTDFDATRTWATATSISSNTAERGLNRLDEEQRAASVAHEIRFDISHTDLLRTDEVARSVAELIA